MTDTSGAEPERLEGRRVAPRFFAVYAMPPLAGRWFTDEEELDERTARGDHQRAVLGAALPA